MYEIFEQLLQKYGVTPYKVGKETGIASSTFTDWKLGRSAPKTDKLQRIADYFNVSLDYLMTGKESEAESTLEAKNNTERELLLLCRSMEDAPQEEKEELIKTFKSTIDIYLRAKGLK